MPPGSAVRVFERVAGDWDSGWWPVASQMEETFPRAGPGRFLGFAPGSPTLELSVCVWNT